LRSLSIVAFRRSGARLRSLSIVAFRRSGARLRLLSIVAFRRSGARFRSLPSGASGRSIYSFLLAVSVLAGQGVASARAESAPRLVYISAGSELSFAAVKAPVPARQYGVVATAAVAALRDPSAAVPSVLGDTASSLPPAGWPRALPGVATGLAPLAARDGRSCDCKTELGDTRRERVAVLYAGRVFTVGDELGKLRMLRLRVRYQDGLVAHINGREVARRNIAPDSGPLDIADRPHGPEWETFHIPVIPGLLRRGDNRLAIEVRPSGHRLAPVLDVELAAGEGARIIRGPLVQRVGRTSATIVFETDLPVAGAVEYGPTESLGQVARSAGGGLAVRHVVELGQLPVGKPVHYRVMAGGDARGTFVTHTAPGHSDVVRFVVYGDVRGGHKAHAEIVAAIEREAPDFVLVTGDLVLRGSDEADWQRFFEVTAGLMARVPYYPVAGNHDMGKSGDQRRRMNEIFELFPEPPGRPSWGHWYSFDVGGVHLVMLDSNSYEHAEQLTWLEQDLEASRGSRARFAVVHDGPYSRGLHRGNTHAAERYVPVLSRHGVTLTFSGHDHLYQRGEIRGFSYIVSGGGGAPLYSVRCGVPRKPRCKVRDGMQHVASEHHYVLVTVFRGHAEVCPRRADSTPVEPCISYRLSPPVPSPVPSRQRSGRRPR
jgi:hypothetical protein